MDGNLLVLVIASAVALAAWGLMQLAMSPDRGNRHKLQRRLNGDWNGEPAALRNSLVRIDKPIENLPAFLAHNSLLKKLNHDLHKAYPQAKLTGFLATAAAVGAGLALIAALMLNSMLAGGIAGLVGLWLPRVWLNSKRASRQRVLVDQLPEALDFLSRVLRAGHSLSTGIQMMGEELPMPIRGEFRRCYDQHSLGQSLEEAMREMAAGVDSSDFAFFVTAVLIQRQTGGDLSEVLTNISTMVRGRLRLQGHVKAITAEGRLTGYILVGFPGVLLTVLYVTNPMYAGLLLHTDIGHIMLTVAVILQVTGMLVIRKIVNVRA